MYEDFFNLKECPFRLPPDPDFLFLSREHKLALVHLEYGLTHQAGFIVITGEIGTGKTTLLKTMLKRMDRDTVVASIFNTTVGPDEFLNLILDDFELEWDESETHTVKLERLKSFLLQTYTSGKKAVLIVDEAQNLSMETLEEIRLLSNIQTSKDYLVHIFLVGQPELKQKLTHPSLRQLAQRISVHYHINPLSKEETFGYINHRLRVSGAKEVEQCFDKDAIEEIYTLTRGYPRLVNLLCDACLVNAFADQLKPVSRQIVLETVKGDGAGNFWAIAGPDGAIQSTETMGKACPSQKPPGSNHIPQETISAIEGRLSDLERTVQILSRLVNEKLLDSSAEKIKNIESKKTLLYLLEREQKKVLTLALERKRLKEKIQQLSEQTQAEGVEDTTTATRHEPEIKSKTFFTRIFGSRSKDEKHK